MPRGIQDTAGPTGPLGVGLLGVGVVGSAVAESLMSGFRRPRAGLGRNLELRAAVVRDLSRKRPVPPELLSNDPRTVLENDAIDIVVELMGGEEPAHEYIARALESGKHVVTANKEVLAKHGDELHDLAAEKGAHLLYEASVGGGIPIVGPLSSDLLGNEVLSIRAIINGTTNYILTRMSVVGLTFDAALREAQSLGYAEADPTSDVDGFDALYKIAILARLAFRTSVPLEAIYREGIRGVHAEDIKYANTLGFTIKLLAVARREDNGLLVRVHPALIPSGVPMAKVDGVLNVCEVEGDLVGPLWLQGRGAGARPTASAVMGDLIRIARRPKTVREDRGNESSLRLLSMAEHECQYYLRLVARDRPGVLAKVAGVLGRLRISIASVIQMDTDPDKGVADIILTTHPSREAQMQRAVREIAGLDVVPEVASLLRVESYPETV